MRTAVPIISNPKVLEEQTTVLRFYADLEQKRRMVSAQSGDEHKASLGQFFTPFPVARFMASFFRFEEEEVSLLDAGAGIGSLTTATAEVVGMVDKVRAISATVVELDPNLQKPLLETLTEKCRTLLERQGKSFSARQLSQDFISLAVDSIRGDMFSLGIGTFSHIILNPPYRKISSTSYERTLLRSVGIEASNLYAAFVGLSMLLLKPGGQLVAITPRSFCNGGYFKPYRELLLREGSIERIHLFDKRDTSFQDDQVLQENVIIHMSKSAKQRARVTVSSSSEPLENATTRQEMDFSKVVYPDDQEHFIHIPSSPEERQVAKTIRRFTSSLKDLGIEVSTGRVVEFRAKEALRLEMESDTVPLLYPLNLTSGAVVWPRSKGKKAQAILDEAATQRLLVPVDTYVLVKRFSSKEEKKRVVAALLDPSIFGVKRIGIENHLNYFHVNGHGLDISLARGLTAYLNSSLVDSYFRQFNGHTQVNAGDLRNMVYPTKQELCILGVQISDNLADQESIDEALSNLIP